MRIAIATDAWSPQINGVVTTLTHTRDQLVADGHEVLMVTPEGRRTVPCPTYPEIRLVLFGSSSIARELDEFVSDCIHIATEGSIGLAVRRYCIRRKLHSRGFRNVVIWTRGVDTEIFRPGHAHNYGLTRPVWVYLGRVAIEKNIESFLDLEIAGNKVVIGDGPDLERLSSSYPDCCFVGYRFGRELAAYLAGADVFVFSSRTDTSGAVRSWRHCTEQFVSHLALRDVPDSEPWPSDATCVCGTHRTLCHNAGIGATPAFGI